MRESAALLSRQAEHGGPRARTRGLVRVVRVPVALLTAFAAVGCVRYVPVDLAAVLPQNEMRVRVTEEAAVRLTRELGRITAQIEGSVQPRGPDSMDVSLWIGRDFAGTPFANVRQTVALARSEVTELRRREVSVGRTVVASAAAAGVFAFLIHKIFLQEDPNPGNDDDIQPPPFSGRVWLRIPIGWSR